jgi:Cu(I)/Ag(I) efflux system membrane fusion protein
VRFLELRLRFVLIIALTALGFGYWETIANQLEKWSRPAARRPEAANRFEYFCPMHPAVVSDRPLSCPNCGMTLARRVRGAIADLPDGVLSRVHLSPKRLAQGGVRTVEVGLAEAMETLSGVGFVGYDETRHVLVASDARGRARVDRLVVDSEGVHVSAGERLAELYSYDVAQAIRVFRDALRSQREHSPSTAHTGPTPLGDPKERVKLAVESLKVLGVRQDQIDALAERDNAGDRLPLLAPMGGYVIRKTAYEGQYLAEGTVAFEIADLSRVWVSAQFFEDQLPLIRVGQATEATVEAFPGDLFEGSVSVIGPEIDSLTRTAQVRFVLENREHRLRPGMLATVSVKMGGIDRPCAERMEPDSALGVAPAQGICPVSGRRLGAMGSPVRVEVNGEAVWLCCDGCRPKLKSAPAKYLARRMKGRVDHARVSVPESSVIQTGSKMIVYVEVEPGVFEGRAIIVGPRVGESYHVVSGLAPGERVAAAGAFLIDAETRLNPSVRDPSSDRLDERLSLAP